MAIEDWDAVIATHLRGTYLLTRAVLPSMQRRGFGRIVNVSSISALGHAGRANYIAAKGDIARAVAFFVADDADFVTGQILHVSGGPHG